MALSVPIDLTDITITPVFKHLVLENVAKSEVAGRAIMETHEVVEVRFAGQKNYSPVFPVTATYRREGLKVITYAERWADQYADFMQGNAQRASGTPLEMLRPYGISESQLSVCRALKIYSVEALHHLEGPAVKSLGMASNDLKRMADEFMTSKDERGTDRARIAELEAQIAAMRQPIPEKEASPDEIDAVVSTADAERESLKARYAELTGARPKGNPNVDTLRSMVEEASA